MYFESYGEIDIVNTIMWGNTSNLIPPYIPLYRSNSCIEGDSISQYPEFVSPSAGQGIGYDGYIADWSLNSWSPCINTGTPDTTGLNLPMTDLAGNYRISGDTIDMGAYEYQIPSFIDLFADNPEIVVYPNPSDGMVCVRSDNVQKTEVWDLNGNLIKSFSNKNSSGWIDLSDMPSGLYIFKLFCPDKIIIEKIILE